ncbi:quinone oxidoreductase family protein [Paenibacillus artemisiicola]|nr:zinc-binding dehydrogenase [Paenibacillus artemisiicola]
MHAVQTMRAIVIPAFGEADVLSLREVPVPEPGPREIAIDVAYAGVNYAEVLFRSGGVPELPLPFVPGIEVSGTVRALGAEVTAFEIGQPVAALSIVGGGGYAEVVTVPAELAFPLEPDRITEEAFAIAAASPSNLATAYLILREVARIRPGETVLVHAAAGGVGSLIGQMARRLGAGRVIGTVGSPDKVAYAKGLGYDAVFLRDGYAEAVMELTAGEGADIVVDPVGGALREEALRLLKPLGRLVAMGNAGGAADVRQSVNELWFASKAVLGFNLQQLSGYAPRLVAEAATTALAMALRGEIRVDVTGVLPLREAAEAHRRIEARRTTGKLALKVR